MSKEQLGEIKARYHLLKRNGYDLGAWDEPFSRLIEQAERVHELERELKVSQSVHADDRKLLIRRTKQNERYREAIKRAIGKFNYDYHQEGMAELLNTLEELE